MTAAARVIGIDPTRPDSFAVILEGRAHFRSDGVIAILQTLPGWRWTAMLLAVPRAWRDWLYDHVARNRHRLFGQRHRCLRPDAAMRAHMVEGAW